MFYREDLELPQIDHFAGHAGYDSVMLELPSTGAHLEFTATAVTPIPSENPYWDQVGVTVCDPDGFRVVLVGQTWP